jgi:plastocyanin
MKKQVEIRHLAGIVFLMTVFIVFTSCSKDNPYGGSSTTSSGGQPGANEVWIQDMAFNPGTITVKAGTTLKWTNKDSVTHTVTADDNSFDSGDIAVNGTFSHTFSTAGTFAYHCKIHPSMKASVVIQ